MNLKTLAMTVSTAVVVSACNSGSKVDGVPHFNEAEMDSTVRIGDNFYEHTNGGWMAANPLPSDKSRMGTFDVLNEENENRIKSILDELLTKQHEKGSDAQRVADLYSCAMDTAQRDADGYKALEPYFTKIDAASSPSDMARLIAELNEVGVFPFFYFGSTTDADNSEMQIAMVWQSGIGLPDRDYYFIEDPFVDNIRNGYKTMATKFAEMIGMENAGARVEAVYEFEKTLAEQMNTRVENRDPQAIWNRRTLDAFKSEVPGFDWDTYIAATHANVGDVSVSQPKYFGKLGEIVAAADKNVVADYLKLMLVRSKASVMTMEFERVSFDYYGKILSGTPEMRPLWKRALGSVNGEELGKLFVEKYFPASSKARMQELIENLRIAFDQRIDELSWMGDSTKIAAKEKLAAIKVKVGYPDVWKQEDYEIDAERGYLGNIIEVSKYSRKEDLEKIGKPVDHEEWFMTPQTVNAYYSPDQNEIVFPAGILQPPFFYAEGDDAVNYGAIGVVIGHEMTHGFDDQGSQYDLKGNLKNWWTEEDRTRFNAATKALADRFTSFTVLDSINLNGELTLGENIADLGGLNIAHQAFLNAQKGVEPELIDGQTADQRFCYSYSRIWASNQRDEYLYNQVKNDPHSPTMWRVNGQLPLLDFFYTAFDVKEGDKMYVAPEDRIVIW